MTVKESFDVAGLPSTWGSPGLKDNIASTNALAVDRWLAAGVVIFGKKNVPLWLADAQTFNEVYGTTNNPWDLSTTPGGSSGGAAAALAAGMTGIEMGSDLASSIRNPAHMCGLYGHKPTHAICPTRGHSATGNPNPIDVLDIGPLGRSAGDVALGLSVMAGPDEIEAAGTRLVLPPPRKKTLRDFKVAVFLNHEAAPVDDEVVDVLQDLTDFLGKKKVKVNDKARPDVDFAEVQRAFEVLIRAATSRQRQTDEEFEAAVQAYDDLRPGDDSKAARGLYGGTLRHRDWLGIDEARHRMRWKWHEFFKTYDVLLCPAFGRAAFEHDHRPGYERTLAVNGEELPFVNQLSWCGYSGMAYLPSTVAPAGLTKEGRPVGVQIVAPHLGDRTSLHFAALLEKEYRAFVPPPGYD